MKLKTWLLLVLGLSGAKTGFTMSQSALDQILQEAISQDRTGVCLQVAVIGEELIKSSACANKESARKLDFDTAFEIGSISKPMTSLVLAGLIDEGIVSLDDTLESLLPTGVNVPSFKGKPILIRHVITHSSGLPALPSLMDESNLDDPYAALTDQILFDSLKDVQLPAKPGAVLSYSNYAMILLSLGLSRSSGISFDELLEKYVFKPVGMTQSYALKKPSEINEAQGHRQTGQPVPAWTFPQNYHGVGGIRSTLDDMVKYVQANLNAEKTSISQLLKMTHQQIAKPSGQSMGMNWMRVKFGGRNLLAHEGGTGGFSSLVAFDLKTKTGIVILSDTSVNALGGLFPLASHLMDPSQPSPKPRVEEPAPEALLKQISGEYSLSELGLSMKAWSQDGVLMVQATGQSAYKMGYDSQGDFYPFAFDAILRPFSSSKGMTFDWIQGGGVIRAKRVSSSNHEAFEVDKAVLSDYIGTYPLMQGFELTVMVKNDDLYIQGTGQAALSVEPLSHDEFSRDDVGAHFIFNRNDQNEVVSLTLKQAGQTLSGDKQ